MSMLYPRLVDLHRLKTVAGSADTVVGLTGYSGAEQSLSSPQGETVLAAGVPASIQAGTTGRKKDASLPQDVVFAPTWFIFIPFTGLAKGTARDRDIIIDDEGYRYEISQAYWNLLGWKLTCIRLEA